MVELYMTRIAVNKSKRVLLGILLGSYPLVATLTCVPARAEGRDIEASKEAVVRDLCSNDGRIARCVGLAASDCASIVRPFVNKCSPLAAKNTKEEPKIAFERCFWSEYLDKYENDIRDTPDCFSSTDKEPLKKLPPEIEREYEPLSTFEERENKESSDTDKQHQAGALDALKDVAADGDF